MSRNSETEDGPSQNSVSGVDCSAEGNLLPVASQPRQPRSLQDLLRYSTEASCALGEPTQVAPARILDEETRNFVEEAIKSVTIDVVEELLKSIKVLKEANSIPEDGDTTQCEEALDNIFDYVDNLDVANDFHKIGGFCILRPCLESMHSSLRWRGAELIAELCQNNPYCQNKVLEIQLMPCLLQMIDSDTEDTVRIKALYAVSCLARDNKEGLEEFVNCDGFSVLLRALQTDIQKLNTKAAFLLTSLCQGNSQIQDNLVNMGYIELLISQLSNNVQICDEGRKSSVEHLLNAVLAIATDHESAQEICRKPELQFKNLLDFVIKNSEDNDQYMEENEYAKSLVQIIFGEPENAEEDR
ncbi:hypothetical protein RUM44_004698 [Polyplax serrata]|uniref:Nucleotide exchange factor Fes1 domain-containing protein n=1 Tax=Polyplax serrata TaxID=468196 RepID=A0ABR1B3J7_POLSC